MERAKLIMDRRDILRLYQFMEKNKDTRFFQVSLGEWDTHFEISPNRPIYKRRFIPKEAVK